MNARAVDVKTTDAPVEGEAATQSEFDALLKGGSSEAARRSVQQPPAGQRERSTDSTAATIGRIASLDENGVVSVALQGWSHSIVARLAAPLSVEQIVAAIASAQPVVMLFEDGDPLRPIIVGLVEAQPRAADAKEQANPVVEADVDGRRVRISARDEIVLQCGEASVTLRRNGRVVIRGTHVESDSQGTNRIKGGQVRIN